MRDIWHIVVHCTDSLWGSPAAVRLWHRERGLADANGNPGYHYLITNGYPAAKSLRLLDGYSADIDGAVYDLRPVGDVGAHCRGWNTGSIGIALVGKYAFTEKQMIALCDLVKQLCEEYRIEFDKVRGHREYWESKNTAPLKSCPNFQVKSIRGLLHSGGYEVG